MKSDTLKQQIKSHPFFQSMVPEHVDILADCATEASYPAGAFLFHEGEPANTFYMVLTGRIALEAHELANGTALVQTLGPGEVLGWSWLLEPFVWHFQARALEPTRVIKLNGGHLLAKAEKNRDFGYDLMKRISHMLVQRLQATRHQLFEEKFRYTPAHAD